MPSKKSKVKQVPYIVQAAWAGGISVKESLGAICKELEKPDPQDFCWLTSKNGHPLLFRRSEIIAVYPEHA